MQKHLGYWQRGSQFWCIKKDKTLLINLPEKNHHYNGDAHIFFNKDDSPVFYQPGRKRITKEEFDKVKKKHLKRMDDF